jgi:hypothetical protein
MIAARLNKLYGKGRWRKLKGFATVRLPDDTIHKRFFVLQVPHALEKVLKRISPARQA